MRSWLGVVREAAARFSLEGAAFLAQAVAFTALFSAFPLILLLTTVVGFVAGEAGVRQALGTVDQYAPPLHDLVAQNLTALVRYRGISGVIGLLGLLWGGKNLFGALAYALNRSLGLPARHVVWDVAVSLVLVPIAGIALLVATVVPVVISVIVRLPGLDGLHVVPEAATYAASLGLVFVVTALLYGYLPNRPGDLRFGIPGAAVAAVGWSLLQVGFATYTTHTNVLQIYGTLATVFATLLWLYGTGLIFLFGAQVSAAWERRRLAAATAAGRTSRGTNADACVASSPR